MRLAYPSKVPHQKLGAGLGSASWSNTMASMNSDVRVAIVRNFSSLFLDAHYIGVKLPGDIAALYPTDYV